MGTIVDDYYVTDNTLDYNRFKTLRKGYALLYYYLSNGNLLEHFWYDKLLGNCDMETLLSKQWNEELVKSAISSIANTIVIDIQPKRKKMADKYSYYRKNAKKQYPSAIFYESNCSYLDFENYSKDITDKLNTFFLLAK